MIVFYFLLFFGILELVISFSNNKLLTSKILDNKIIINEDEYKKESRKRHRINGVIFLLMSIFYFLAIDKYEPVVMFAGLLLCMFNGLFFDSNTRMYIKDKS